MRVGILSDSHGDDKAVSRALAIFDDAGAEEFIHCGDVCGVDVFDRFVGRRLHFVWGNCDVCDGPLVEYLRTVGIEPPAEVPLRITLGGKRFAVVHGHESAAADSSCWNDSDYLLHGHSHQRRDERVGRTRIINPGALYRVRTRTVAVLDTDTDDLSFHKVD